MKHINQSVITENELGLTVVTPVWLNEIHFCGTLPQILMVCVCVYCGIVFLSLKLNRVWSFPMVT